MAVTKGKLTKCKTVKAHVFLKKVYLLRGLEGMGATVHGIMADLKDDSV